MTDALQVLSDISAQGKGNANNKTCCKEIHLKRSCRKGNRPNTKDGRHGVVAHRMQAPQWDADNLPLGCERWEPTAKSQPHLARAARAAAVSPEPRAAKLACEQS